MLRLPSTSKFPPVSTFAVGRGLRVKSRSYNTLSNHSTTWAKINTLTYLNKARHNHVDLHRVRCYLMACLGNAEVKPFSYHQNLFGFALNSPHNLYLTSWIPCVTFFLNSFMNSHAAKRGLSIIPSRRFHFTVTRFLHKLWSFSAASLIYSIRWSGTLRFTSALHSYLHNTSIMLLIYLWKCPSWSIIRLKSPLRLCNVPLR